MRVLGAWILSVLLLGFLAGCSEKGSAEEPRISVTPFEEMVKKLGENGVLSQKLDSTVAYPIELSDEMMPEGISVTSSNPDVFEVELEGSRKGLIITTSATEPTDQLYVILEYMNNEEAKPIIAHIPLVLEGVKESESAKKEEVVKTVEAEKKSETKQPKEKNSVSGNNENSSILGIWYMEEEGAYFTFKADGTAVVVSDDKGSEMGAYKITGNQIEFFEGTESGFMDFRVNDDQLILGYQGQTQTLVRSNEEAMKKDLEQKVATTEKTAEQKEEAKRASRKLPELKTVNMPDTFYSELKKGKIFDSDIQLGMTLEEMRAKLGEPEAEGDNEGSYFYSYGTHRYGHGYMQDKEIEVIWYHFEPGTGPSCEELEKHLGPTNCVRSSPDEDMGIERIGYYQYKDFEIKILFYTQGEPEIGVFLIKK